jgi:uncharacterized protein YecE (DUF72 family)
MQINDPATRYRIGTASWTDPTLLAAGFYPGSAKTAESRLRFYARHFDTVEVDSTYYALPSERNAALWAARTPEGFCFNVKAFAWLTCHPAETRRLPHAIRSLLPAAAVAEPRLQRPPIQALDAAFAMFRSALQPLRAAGKLGCLLLQFPPWFTAGAEHEAYLDYCRSRLPADRLAIELRHASWFNARTASTLDALAQRGLVLVCTDAPPAPSIPRPPWRATTDVAYVRLHGRNRAAWFRHGASAAERFQYLYSNAELAECAAGIRSVRDARGARARVVHVIFNNCYADYGVRNARSMQALLEAGGA